MRPHQFKNAEPRLDVEGYFAGHTQATGMFFDRFGALRRQFRVRIDGVREDGHFALYEKFDYDDGEKEERVWRIRRTGDHSYVGTADNIIGEATGALYGNVLNWRYLFDLDMGGWSLRVRFDDWMFLQPNGVLLNRAKVSKAGLVLGHVFISFAKPGVEAAQQQAAE